MSSVRALVGWMKDNNHWHSTNYCAETRYVAGKYFSFGLCWTNVSLALDEHHSPALKRLAITAIDNETGKNSFHYLFSNGVLGRVPDSERHDYFVLYDDYKKAKKIGIGYLDDDFQLEQYTEAHAKLLTEQKLTSCESESGKRFRKNNLTTTVGLLLAPFTNTSEEHNDPALVYVLLHKDSRGNMPLFYFQEHRLFYSYDRTQLFTELDTSALYERVKQLSESYKSRLLLEENEGGKTLLHQLVSHLTGELKTYIEIFGPNAVKAGLCQADKKGNTPIHNLFSLKNASDALVFVQSMCELIKPPKSVEEEKHALEQKQDSDSRDYFPVNLQGLNPLHILSKRAASEINPKIFEALLGIMPDNLKSKKIMQVDKEGFTPVHYAIESRNFGLAYDMINKLSRTDQLKLILMEHGKKENLLHYICQFGSNDLLCEVIRILGPAELHRIRIEMPLKKYENKWLCSDSRDTSMKKYSKLFDIFDYLVRTYNPGCKNFDARFEDFCACYDAICKGDSLPAMDLSFYPKTHGVLFVKWPGSDRYHRLRFSLSGLTQQEREDFADYLSRTAADSRQSKHRVSIVAQDILERVKKINNPDKKDQAALASEPSGDPWVLVNFINPEEEVMTVPGQRLEVPPPSPLISAFSVDSSSSSATIKRPGFN